MADDIFWIDVSGKISGLPDVTDDPKEIYGDTNRAVKFANRQAMDVKEYFLEKYSSVEEDSLTQNNPAFAFLYVSKAEEKKFEPISVYYNMIQRYAVVLHAMIQDKEDDSRLSELLKSAKHDMMAILGNLEILMEALQVEKMKDVSRDILPNELKKPQAIPLRNVYCIVFYLELLKLLETQLQKERSTSRSPPGHVSQFFSFGNRGNFFHLALITFLGLSIIYFSYKKKSNRLQPN